MKMPLDAATGLITQTTWACFYTQIKLRCLGYIMYSICRNCNQNSYPLIGFRKLPPFSHEQNGMFLVRNGWIRLLCCLYEFLHLDYIYPQIDYCELWPIAKNSSDAGTVIAAFVLWGTSQIAASLIFFHFFVILIFICLAPSVDSDNFGGSLEVVIICESFRR